MARNALTPFEKAQNQHERAIAKSPIGRTALLNSLSRLDDAGSSSIARNEINVGKYATVMHGAYSGVSELHVQPPLSDGQRDVVAGKVAGFATMLEANPQEPQEAPAVPTDTNTIPTDSRKS